MKTTFAKVSGGLALLAVSSVAMASVVNTAHNLGASGEHNHSNATSEICIFCHTPHGGDQSAYAPLWNRGTASTSLTYTRYSTLNRLTFDSAEAPVGSVSAACLSCHDGTQAINAVINTSGLDTVGNLGTFDGEAGFMGTMAAPDGAWYSVSAGQTGGRGDMVYLGTDLRNDHPISMQYGGGGITSTALTAQTYDPDFAQAVGAMDYGNAAVLSGTGNPGGLEANFGVGFPSRAGLGNTTSDNTNNVNGSGGAIVGIAGSGTGVVQHDTTVNGHRWWVDTTANATFESEDFPLYTRTDVSTQVDVQPTVECGTCHDPHSGNSTFLRLAGGNRSSAVCLTCHAK
jgi:predicted CXXCH cytochrome family protein